MEFGDLGLKLHELFENRTELTNKGIHRPPRAGIWGNRTEGACSIVLSGGYIDDIDQLDYILYTGEGGRDPKSKRQVKDQEYIRGNKGLQISHEFNLPVRVIRDKVTKYGPKEGLRYDGLYYVSDYERIRGKDGFFICRFHMVSEDQNIISSLEKSKSFKDELPKIKEYVVSKHERKPEITIKIKNLYKNTCQICNEKLISPKGLISVGAHIRGLGKPHDGPDSIENLLCLCPNHHALFDSYAFYIEPHTYKIIGLEEFKDKKINILHKINNEHLEYQKKLFERNN